MGIIPEKKCFKEPSQLIKFIVLFVCCIFTCTQVAQCLEKYLYPPASTHAEFILNDSIRYPCLTICRRPSFKIHLFQPFGVLTSSIESPNAFRNFDFFKFNLTNFFDATTYNFHDIFGQIAYGSQGYSSKYPKLSLKITPSFHIKRGRCFTFQPLRPTDIFSISGGYVFYMFHDNRNQRLNDYGVSTHGFQIYLHQPNEAVTFDEDESNNFLEILDLEASEDMRVKFEIQEFGRLSTNERPCKEDANYSKSTCEELCINEQIVRMNNCTAPFLVLPENVDFPECSSFDSIRNVIRQYTVSSYRNLYLENCQCPLACNFTVYKTSIINRRGIETQLEPNSMFCLYSTNLLFRMTEVLGYDFNQLLSDVGGSLGFLLGLSVISLIYLCEEIFIKLFSCFFRNKSQKKPDELENNISHIDETTTTEELVSNSFNSRKEADITELDIKGSDIKEVPYFKNISKFITNFDFNKKDSELSGPNTNPNLKY